MQPEQNFASHRRFHPAFHFFIIPVLTIGLLINVVFLFFPSAKQVAFRAPIIFGLWSCLVAAALLTLALLARTYSLRQQDRIIRLEERLRLQSLLPEDLRSRINELRTSQLIALRFCSDEELSDATRAVLAGEVMSQNDIKKRVKNWRADNHRI
jgi:hypothetical protein